MTTQSQQAPSPTGPRALAGALAAGLAMAVLALLVLMAMTGDFGQVLKGIRLSPPSPGPVDGDLVRWSLGLAVTAGVLTTSLFWRWSRASAAIAPIACLLAVSPTLLLVLDGADWAMTCLPATLTALVFFALGAKDRSQEPLARRDGAPLLQLSTAALLAGLYAVVVLVVSSV